MLLTPRQLNILSALVEIYIQTIEPVGSKAVCEKLNMSCSPATVRNEMSELFEKGLIEQPHTSAGRIPSQAGYRLYVDHLMNRYSLSDADKQYIIDLLPKKVESYEELIETAGKALAEFTHCAAFSTTPVDNDAKIKNIEIFPLSQRKLIVVSITDSGIIKSRVCNLDLLVSFDQIQKYANILNAKYKDKVISEISRGTVQGLATELGTDIFHFAPILDSFMATVDDAKEAKVLVGGQENLLVHREFSPLGVHKLLSYLSDHNILMSLFSERPEQTSILFGSETNESALTPAGFVASYYKVGVKRLGQIGIIGPARMDYVHLIPSIEFFADSMGNILSKSVNNEDWS